MKNKLPSDAIVRQQIETLVEAQNIISCSGCGGPNGVDMWRYSWGLPSKNGLYWWQDEMSSPHRLVMFFGDYWISRNGLHTKEDSIVGRWFGPLEEKS